MPRYRLILGGILALAFVLRVIFNTHELPPVFVYPNEFDKRDMVLSLAQEEWDHGISMPSLLYNTTWLIYQPARALHVWGSEHATWLAPFRMPLMTFYLWVGRVSMAFWGTAAVWLIYLLGRRLGSRRIGLIAAGLLAIVPIHVLGSRHMKEDMPLGFMMTAAILFMVDMVGRGRLKDTLRAALLVGLCISTKWVGAVVGVPFLVAHQLARRRHGPPAHGHGRAATSAMVAGCILLGFFAASPDYLTRLGDIDDAFERGASKPYEGHSDGMAVSWLEEGLTDYWQNGLWPGLTPPVLLLALGGFFWLRRRGRSEQALLLGAWIVFFYLLLETARARPYPHYQRYLQPIVPSLVVLAACGVEGVRRWLLRRRRRPITITITTHDPRRTKRRTRVALALAVTIAILWPLHDTARHLWQIPHSTSGGAYAFLMREVPPGATVLTDNYGPLIDEARFNRVNYRKKDRLQFERFPEGPAYVVASSMGLGRYLEHPRANPEMTRFAEYVDAVGTPLGEWRPAFRSYYGLSPTITIYRFDGAETPFLNRQPPAEEEEREE